MPPVANVVATFQAGADAAPIETLDFQVRSVKIRRGDVS